MKKQTLSILSIVMSHLALAQVGINNTSPKATLDITAKTTNGSKAEGIIAPRLTGDQIRSADSVYTSAQLGTIIYATSAVTSPISGSKTEYITTAGYYFYDGSKWQKFSTSGSGAGSSYLGSTSISLNGSSFERAALTGDVTAAANSNATTVAKIQGRSVSATAPTNGQVLKYNTATSAWEPAAESGTGSSYTAGSGLTLTGTAFSANDATTSAKGIVQLAGDLAGTSASPTVAKIQGKAVSTTAPTNGQVLKYNTSTNAWEPGTDANASYTGSTSVALNGSSFERSALTGDVTASANSNATTISNSAVTTAKIADGAVTTAKITGSTTNGQVLTTNASGVTSWVTPVDNNTTYTAGSGLTLTGTAFSANDATTSAKGIVQLAGDLAGTSASPSIASNAVTSAKILDGTIATADIANSAITTAKIAGSTTNGQVLTTNASGVTSWVTPVDNNTTYTAGSGLTLTGTAFSANDATTSAKGIVQLAGDLAGTSASPTVAKIQGKAVSTTAPTNGQVLKYNTTTNAWEPGTDANASYTGSTSVALNGSSFERSALTGDVTASANSNATTISNSAVTTAKIADGAVTTAKITGSTTNGQVLTTNASGVTSWVTPVDNNTTYTAGSGLTLTGTAFSANDATTSAKGIVQLAGDLAGTSASPSIASNAVTSAKILDGTIATADIANSAITTAKIAGSTTNGQVLTTNASGVTSWVTPVDNNTTYTAGSGLTLTGTAFSANDATTSAKGIVQLAGDLAGTSGSPTVAKIQGKAVSTTAPTNGQVLKYNTTTSAWEPGTDANASYTGSTSVALNGSSFERSALTGDVTASANSNATTISNSAVTTAKIADGAVTTAKITGSTTNGQVLTTNASGVTS